ncbi:hypothetical protein ACJX0J_012862 [Zea mays]
MHYIILGLDFSDTTIFHRPQFFSDVFWFNLSISQFLSDTLSSSCHIWSNYSQNIVLYNNRNCDLLWKLSKVQGGTCQLCASASEEPCLVGTTASGLDDLPYLPIGQQKAR